LREKDHAEQLEEIRISAEERNAAILRAMVDQGIITQEQADAITEILKQAFGPNGVVDGIYAYLAEITVQAVESVSASIGALQSMINSIGRVSYNVEGIQSMLGKRYTTGTLHGKPTMVTGGGGGASHIYAEGGTLIADRPTTAIFGDKGPEIAHFTPLNRTGKDVNKVFGSKSLLGNNSEFMKVQLWLSPDLEARVVDKSVGVVADVMQGRVL